MEDRGLRQEDLVVEVVDVSHRQEERVQLEDLMVEGTFHQLMGLLHTWEVEVEVRRRLAELEVRVQVLEVLEFKIILRVPIYTMPVEAAAPAQPTLQEELVVLVAVELVA
jgi:hypothetical protein